MYIGKLSRLTGASRKAIYLYEEMGLIPMPQRKGTYRVYAAETVEIIQTIRCAQTLGFRLTELAEVLQDTADGRWPALDGIITQLERKRLALQAQIDTALAKIALLDALRQRLTDAPGAWACGEALDSAPGGKL